MNKRLVLGAAAMLGGAVIALAVIVSYRLVGADEPPLRPDPTTPSTETLDQQIARVAAVVEQVRALEFPEPPELTVISPEELADRVALELQAYTPEDAAEDERILEALGVLTPEQNLRQLIIRSYSEQVAGFYDPTTGELVVGADTGGERLGRIEEIILAHELEHALADQTLGLPTVEEPEDGEEDAALARQALTEGDATITMQRYVEEGFSVVDQLLLPAEVADLTAQLVGITELPHYLQRSLLFPYEEGAVFVDALLSRGGWELVNQAYDQPPTTTAQILFPERYPGPTSLPLDPPVAPEAPWSLLRESAFGAADLLFLFEAPGNETSAALADPLVAAGTWRGGALHLYGDGDESAVGIALATSELATLCTAVAEWYDAAHSDDRLVSRVVEGAEWRGGRWAATLECEGQSVRLGIAPRPEVASALVGG
ncbi:MAG: hypothetical protein R3320_04525 [Nitriliruptorales bacterium]|nr:hypothetical protein [Nitriliruptorales bacterium]